MDIRKGDRFRMHNGVVVEVTATPTDRSRIMVREVIDGRPRHHPWAADIRAFDVRVSTRVERRAARVVPTLDAFRLRAGRSLATVQLLLF